MVVALPDGVLAVVSHLEFIHMIFSLHGAMYGVHLRVFAHHHSIVLIFAITRGYGRIYVQRVHTWRLESNALLFADSAC
jgi:hypothetical protein